MVKKIARVVQQFVNTGRSNKAQATRHATAVSTSAVVTSPTSATAVASRRPVTAVAPSPPPPLRNVANAPFAIQQATVLRAVGENGVAGNFTYPLQKLVVSYCELGGSSAGMRDYIRTRLVPWAARNPQFEVIVQPQPFRHPHVRAFYDNGHRKFACARNKQPDEIHRIICQYRDTPGLDPIKPKRPVLSPAETSVRGVWSPFRDPALRPAHQPLAPSFLYSNNF